MAATTATHNEATPEVTRTPLELLTGYKTNPRRGNVQVIAESLSALGQYKPIVANRGTRTGRPGEVLAGNHTLQAAEQLGWTHLTVAWVDVDEDDAARIVAVDNRASDLATYDDEVLAQLLGSLPDLSGTGYTLDDLDALVAAPKPITGDPDDVGDVPRVPVSRPGDVWLLGPHRLGCVDATSGDQVTTVMGGGVADAMWTDPPYGVDYVGKTAAALTIVGDDRQGLRDLLAAAFTVASQHLRPGAPVYVAHADTERTTFEETLRGAGIIVRQNLIWVKNTIVMGRSDYHYRHEPVLYGFTAGGKGRLGRGGDRWYGNNSQATTFDVPKPARSESHPTMKPVALIQAHLTNSVRPGGVASPRKTRGTRT